MHYAFRLNLRGNIQLLKKATNKVRGLLSYAKDQLNTLGELVDCDEDYQNLVNNCDYYENLLRFLLHLGSQPKLEPVAFDTIREKYQNADKLISELFSKFSAVRCVSNHKTEHVGDLRRKVLVKAYELSKSNYMKICPNIALAEQVDLELIEGLEKFKI